MTSQNIDLSSWDILYMTYNDVIRHSHDNVVCVCVQSFGLNSTICWNVTPCNPVKLSEELLQARNQQDRLGLFFTTQKWMQYIAPKRL
jgi:hypothetical protein